MKIKIQIFATVIIILLSLTPIYSQIIDTTKGWVKVAGGLNFPEGPAYDENSSLYFSNCYGGWIGKINLTDGTLDTFIIKSSSRINISKTNGLAYDKDNFLYVCEYGYGQILRIDKKGKAEVFANGFKGERFNRPNDIVIDAEGNLFFTDPKNYNKDSLDGRIFFINRSSGKIKLVAEGLAFPNGINISPVDHKLYVCESAKHKIIRFDIAKDYQLINEEDFVQLPGGDPDGIEFDNKGNLFAAHYGGKAVYVFSPEGKLLQKVETPGSKPTNLEFGGKDFKTLYLTEVETNSIYKIYLEK
jgi:gluconolactonase